MLDPPDVGFGISQVLPVLVQCFYAPAGSIILIEQPEIHLHPNAQFGAGRCNDRSHQLPGKRIRQGYSAGYRNPFRAFFAPPPAPHRRRCSPSGKSIGLFRQYRQDTRDPEPLQIDIFGNIQNWPENFFGDEMGDITEQAKAAMKKRMQKSEKPEASE